MMYAFLLEAANFIHKHKITQEVIDDIWLNGQCISSGENFTVLQKDNLQITINHHLHRINSIRFV